MSYDQTFKGSLTYADHHCLEAGLDKFVAAAGKDSIIRLDDLTVDGLTVTVDMDCSAPASMYDATTYALGQLASEAKTGRIAMTFVLDGTSRESRSAGGRTKADGLPPRHRRWELFFAATNGDAKALRALASDGVDLAQRFAAYHDRSALQLAAKAGSGPAIEVLLGAGVPLDGALVAATNAAAVEALLAAGAKVTPEERKQIVQRCARDGDVARLHALVKADPQITDAFGDPDVMTAAIEGGESVLVDLLLEHGAQLPPDFITRAIREGATALVESALRAPDAVAACGPSSGRRDAMCQAANDCNLPLLQLLAKHGVPIHPATPGETSPIHRAVMAYDDGRLACLRWLLDQGAPVDARTAEGESVLRTAVEAGNGELAALLVARGADPSVLDAIPAEDLPQIKKDIGATWWKKIATAKAASTSKASSKTKAKPTASSKAKPTKASSTSKASSKTKAKPTASSKTKASTKAKPTSKVKASSKAKSRPTRR